jgi:hypothetical protein
MSKYIFSPIFTGGFPKEIKEETSIRYDSYLSIEKKDTETGLSNQEIDEWMPFIVGCSLNSPDFRDRVDKYFKEFSLRVPFSGIELNAALDDKGFPVNFDEFIAYRIASLDKTVAKGEEADSAELDTSFYNYTLKTIDSVKQQELKTFETKSKAIKCYTSLISKPEADTRVLKGILVVNRELLDLGIDTINEASRSDVEHLLYKLLESNSQAIIDAEAKYSEYNIKSMIELALYFDIVNLEGEEVYKSGKKLASNVSSLYQVLSENSTERIDIGKKLLALNKVGSLLPETKPSGDAS